MRTFILTITMFVIAAGCATTGTLLNSAAPPAWTQIAPCTRQGERVLAVGTARGVKNIALARTAAGNRARAALTRCQYGTEERTVRTGGGVVRTSYTSGKVVGATVDAYFVDPETGDVSALASMPVDGSTPPTPLAAATE